MPEKYDCDTLPGVRLLRIFRKLSLNDRKYYQGDLAREFMCSPQTIIRIMADIEAVIGDCLQTGLDNRRRWYRIVDETTLSRASFMEAPIGGLICSQKGLRTSRKDEENIDMLRFMKTFNEDLPKQSVPAAFFQDINSAIAEKTALNLLYKDKFGKKEYLFAPSRLLKLKGENYAAGAVLEKDMRPAALALLELSGIRKIRPGKKAPVIDFEKIAQEPCALEWIEWPENLL